MVCKLQRTTPATSHENGSIESPHGHIKRRIKQAFLLRGSYDFKSVADYQEWLEGVVIAHNRRNAKAVQIERKHLQPLPIHKTADYTEVAARVSSSSTIIVRRTLYTVPSRLKHRKHIMSLLAIIRKARLKSLGKMRGRLGNMGASQTYCVIALKSHHSLSRKQDVRLMPALRVSLDLFSSLWAQC